jgi:predicted SnoaL-like aldol condensation-catalyzing enzyme
MHPPLFSLAALLALAGCSDSTASENTAETTASADDRDGGPGCIRTVAAGFKDLFYDQGRVREAYETYVAEDYKQHNPMAQDGREAAIAFLEPIYERNPQHRMTVHRMIVEDPYIVVHLHGQSSPDDLGAAAVDILRVEDCKIVEHWDVTQPVPADPINRNGMF